MRKKQTPSKIDTQTPKTQIPSITLRSPKKVEPFSSSKKPKPSPIKVQEGSEQIISNSDREQMLLLEIKQLKRQNNFLKKKITQLNTLLGRSNPKLPKQKQKRAASTLSVESVHLSLNSVFEEVNNILETVVKLYRIEIVEDELHDKYKKQSQLSPIKKQFSLKKQNINQKLERILIEKEQQRYTLLLNLFTEYYMSKQQNQQKIIQNIDVLTLKAYELNQMIIQKAQEKKKERGTFSTIKEDDIHLSTLKAPTTPTKNFIAQNKMMTHSPIGHKNGKKATRFPASPTEKGKIYNF